jgi:hypothetical protein
LAISKPSSEPSWIIESIAGFVAGTVGSRGCAIWLRRACDGSKSCAAEWHGGALPVLGGWIRYLRCETPCDQEATLRGEPLTDVRMPAFATDLPDRPALKGLWLDD